MVKIELDGVPIVGHVSIQVEKIACDIDEKESEKEENSSENNKPTESKKIHIDFLKTDLNVGMAEITLIKYKECQFVLKRTKV